MRKILLYISLLLSVLATAQVVDQFPYECSFEGEDSENLSAWVLNALSPTPAPTDSSDRWMIGSAVHSEGRKSLYISSDRINPVYGKNPNVVVSYLRLKFPDASETQRFDISFDWKGGKSGTDSRLYVMFCTESELADINSEFCLARIVSTTSGSVPQDTRNLCEKLGETVAQRSLCDGERWQNVSLTTPVRIGSSASSETFALVFIWENDNVNDVPYRSSIAIDNVQISTAALKKPKNLDVVSQCEDSALLVSWESGLREFEVQWRSLSSNTWNRLSHIVDGAGGFVRENGTQCSYAIQDVAEGSYEVRVRGLAGDSTTNYVYRNLVLVFCPENHCVNYIDLQSAKCTWGYYESGNHSPYENIGVVDFGPDDIKSRHTIHIDTLETDPRTDGMLRTVPPGAVASVRLGNWEVHSEAESITYDITVDSANQGILIVRYAIVFQDPTLHRGHDEEFFNLEVLDKNGQLIDPDCGHASFNFSDAVASEWNNTLDGTVWWKDWTYVGINLQEHNGEDIRVRLTTMDCGLGAHYGYAYFTVDCINAYITTENCGDDARLKCEAPEGFYYKWLDENDNVIGTDQNLDTIPGPQTYRCELSFKEDTACHFTLKTLAAPRYPFPEYSYEINQSECRSQLKFTNTSHVINKYADNVNHTTEGCKSSDWVLVSLSNGTVTKYEKTKEPVHPCPVEGDTIEVTMTSYIGVNNACAESRVDTIVIPTIITPDSVLQVTTCPEAPYKFAGEYFDKDTTVVKTFKNHAGCDSTITFYLDVTEVPFSTYVTDSICSDQSITIGGVQYSEPLINKEIQLQTVNGCDSFVYLTLIVNERLQATVEPMAYACADDEQLFISFDIAAGEYDSLEIKFNTPEMRDTMIYDKNVTAIAIPYPDTIIPGHYQATLRFYQYCCGVYEETRDFDIRYRSSIVEQKWNDVLTLLSPKHNGGYEFTAFQWYKDGEPILNETHSYLYQDLDMEATYYVELTRADGTIVATCPIQPVYHEQQTAFPTIVSAGQHLPMYMERKATIWYYTISGQLYSTFTLPQGYTSLPAPGQSGSFIIKSVNADGETQAQIMIVQ